MVKFIDYWMFAHHIWNDGPSTPTAINMNEITHIEEVHHPNLGIHTIVFLKNQNAIPIEGDAIEILAEFQKHLQTMY